MAVFCYCVREVEALGVLVEDDGCAKAVEEAYSPSSCLGPRPSLMSARASGVDLVCQPLSAWNFCMAAWVCASHAPVALPFR